MSTTYEPGQMFETSDEDTVFIVNVVDGEYTVFVMTDGHVFMSNITERGVQEILGDEPLLRERNSDSANKLMSALQQFGVDQVEALERRVKHHLEAFDFAAAMKEMRSRTSEVSVAYQAYRLTQDWN